MDEELSKNEAFMKEYSEKQHAAHEQDFQMHATPSGIIKYHLSKSKDECEALISFMFETNYGGSRLAVYMPDPSQDKFTGKIIVECTTRSKEEAMYLEVQLATVTDFSGIETVFLDKGHWSTVVIFRNIRLARDKAVKFVQTLLFDDHFTQRFLMTTSSEVMGSMTTQRLRSESGQVLSFRRCVLNE